MTETKVKEIMVGYNIIQVITQLDFLILDDSTKLGVYQDQDRHNHIVLLSENYNEKQLDMLYSSLFGVGTMCQKRSRVYHEVLKGYPEGTSAITIASIFQGYCYGLNDMRLMAMVSAWTDGLYTV